jgi:thiol-disulfide isomerase/thioredoxin
MVREIQSAAEWHALAGSGKTILANIYRPNCGHCDNIEPVFEKLCSGFEANSSAAISSEKTNVECVKINANKDFLSGRIIMDKLQLSGTPTFVQHKDGASSVVLVGADEKGLTKVCGALGSKTAVSAETTK